MKFDMDALNTAITSFSAICDEFKTAYGDLDKAIDQLRSSDWVSAAGTAYFAQYDDTWKVNMDKHIKILEHLLSCLEKAKSEYSEIDSRMSTIGKDLTSIS